MDVVLNSVIMIFMHLNCKKDNFVSKIIINIIVFLKWIFYAFFMLRFVLNQEIILVYLLIIINTVYNFLNC